MNHDRYDDDYIVDILKSVKVIALVGASPDPSRPSNAVMRYLQEHGYRVNPVNPGQAGKTINGAVVAASLADVDGPVDMVDVFRASQYLPKVVEDALAMPQPPKVIWSQLGVRDDAAAALAERAGVKVVMNRCPAIEIPRLLGEHAR
ncbi:CoA-binding protein [Rhizobiaceae bacterium BDR2-2]|uniref:CoA-binding protein n=1 Tax=Ectorhizobium quercum TaxID=2965071 RepID=A0AAE3SWN7_9HYPH|nr:CoA-binding protein [Ectorhizobium quercum]MCX8998948.1 CoA-binding protein [Ectorhizobium quercum]